MRWIESVIVAFSMYSKIPMPHIEWTKQNMRYTMCFFPLVGAVIGFLMWLWCRICGLIMPGSILRGAVFVLIPVIVTGGIHLDGLLDTADALSSWQPREKRLEILKDSHAGAFAVIACCGYFLAAFGIWSEAAERAVMVLGIGFILSRALSAFGVCTFPLAKDSGLAAAFSDAAGKERCRLVLILEAAACVAGMLVLSRPLGLACAVSAVAVCFFCRQMAVRKFGGITGDIQGFFLQMCELVMAFAVILLEVTGL